MLQSLKPQTHLEILSVPLVRLPLYVLRHHEKDNPLLSAYLLISAIAIRIEMHSSFMRHTE